MTITTHPTPRVIIIGGGITGLSAAWTLQKQGTDTLVLEAADSWGGKIQTAHRDGFVIEEGPDSFITQKPWALQLARELGVDEQLLPTNDDKRKVFIANKGRLTPLPDGVMMVIPTKFMPFALTPLFGPFEKLRMGLDLIIPPKTDDEDETVAEFIQRRLGHAALDKLAEPLMSGIYNAEAESQSVMATFPRFRAIEAKHGSLIRGMLAARKNRPPKKSGAKKTSMFTSMRGGMAELVEALVEQLEVDMRLNAPVKTITHNDDGSYTVTLKSGEQLPADAVIITTPAFVAGDLVADIAPEATDLLNTIDYVNTGTVSLGFRRDEVAHPLDGFGIVIPRSEERPINAVTWTSTKFDHRSPADQVLLRVFVGGSRNPAIMHEDDETLLRTAREQLADLMGVAAEPTMVHISRWFGATPQYHVGHVEKVEAIDAALPPGVMVAGAAYRGIGLPDCVHQGQQAAEKVPVAVR